MRPEGEAPRVRLTFDDGPGPSTADLLDVLKAKDVKATFFLLGKNVMQTPEVVTRMFAEGHTVGNHTFTHARPENTSAEEFIDEILRVDEALAELARQAGSEVKFFPFRLPYGPKENDVRVPALASIGKKHVHWTCLVGDWHTPRRSPRHLEGLLRVHLSAQIEHKEAVVFCLHDSSTLYESRDETVEAVRLLLSDDSVARLCRTQKD